MKTAADLLVHPRATTAEALTVFDAAQPVSPDFMTGRWRGKEVFTGHRLNGLLTAAGWYGKAFLENSRAHPLLFCNLRRTELFAVNPALVPLWFTPPKWKVLHILLNLARPVLETRNPKAELSMAESRGKTTAKMIYDDKPISDYFVKLSEDAVLGVMERKGEREPFSFLLFRN